MNKYMKKLSAAAAFMVVMVLLSINSKAQGVPGSVWGNADEPSALLVRYVGTSEATVTFASALVTITNEGVVSTLALGPATALSAVKSAIEGSTNATGKANLECMYWAGLAADTVSNKFIAASARFVSGSATYPLNKWTAALGVWDTSVALHYDAVITPIPMQRGVIGGERLTSIIGDPTGTGNVTVKVYSDGTLKYQCTKVSPVYVWPATVGGTNDTTMTADAVVSLEEEHFGSGLYNPPGKVMFVRVARATTATTGGIGATAMYP